MELPFCCYFWCPFQSVKRFRFRYVRRRSVYRVMSWWLSYIRTQGSALCTRESQCWYGWIPACIPTDWSFARNSRHHVRAGHFMTIVSRSHSIRCSIRYRQKQAIDVRLIKVWQNVNHHSYQRNRMYNRPTKYEIISVTRKCMEISKRWTKYMYMASI